MLKPLAISFLVLASTASAEDARQLFEQGRTQRAAGDLDEACKSFEASYDKEPAAGTALNLAECEERAGEWQFALELYEGAAQWFEREDRAASAVFARQRAAVLRAAHPAPQLAPIEAPPRSKVPLVVAGVGFGVALVGIGVRIQAQSAISDIDNVMGPTVPERLRVTEDDCGEVTFTSAGDQAVFERSCRAARRGRIGAYTAIAGTAVGLGALIYYVVAKPKAHAPIIAPTASGGVSALFEW